MQCNVTSRIQDRIGMETNSAFTRQILVKSGRGDWIRTSDISVPNRALYQAEPRPDGQPILSQLSALRSIHRIGRSVLSDRMWEFLWNLADFIAGASTVAGCDSARTPWPSADCRGHSLCYCQCDPATNPSPDAAQSPPRRHRASAGGMRPTQPTSRCPAHRRPENGRSSKRQLFSLRLHHLRRSQCPTETL